MQRRVLVASQRNPEGDALSGRGGDIEIDRRRLPLRVEARGIDEQPLRSIHARADEELEAILARGALLVEELLPAPLCVAHARVRIDEGGDAIAQGCMVGERVEDRARVGVLGSEPVPYVRRMQVLEPAVGVVDRAAEIRVRDRLHARVGGGRGECIRAERNEETGGDGGRSHAASQALRRATTSSVVSSASVR